jgi:hypothetical protein
MFDAWLAEFNAGGFLQCKVGAEGGVIVPV